MVKNNSIPELTAARLRELFNYDPETGLFTRLVQTASNARVGTVAGSLNKGYILVCVDRMRFFGHRLAWLYVHGRFPAKHIDHINGIGHDNRIVNLRECTHYENLQNITARKHSTSGYVGASFHKQTGKWQSKIRLKGKHIYLGVFQSKEEAHEAYVKAKAKYHQFQPTIRISA
jgi:hypothetical protein